MPLITISTPVANFETGTYEMELRDVYAKNYPQFAGEGQFGPDTGDRLVWLWVDPESDEFYVEQLTSLATGTKSRTNEILVALLGPDAVIPGKGFDKPDLVGKRALVSLVPNEKGYPKVDKVTALPRKAARPKPVESEPQTELPF